MSPNVPARGFTPVSAPVHCFACATAAVTLTGVSPSRHKSACPPASVRARLPVCAWTGVSECVCVREWGLARPSLCPCVSPTCPCAGTSRPPQTLTFFPFRPGLPSSPGFPCGSTLSVRSQGWGETVRAQKGALKARTYHCSRGARGARRSLFSSEARKPLEKVFSRIKGDTEISLGIAMDLEDPAKILLQCRNSPELGGAIEIPSQRPQGLGEPPAEIPRGRNLRTWKGTTNTPKAEKARKCIC